MKVMYWILGNATVYLIAAFLGVKYLGIPVELTQVVWLVLLSMPFYIRPIAKWLEMDIPWFKY